MLSGVCLVTGVVVYRVSVYAALYLTNQMLIIQFAAMLTSTTAAMISLIVLFILKYVSMRFTSICRAAVLLTLILCLFIIQILF